MITFDQALGLGLTAKQVRGRIASGRWVAVGRGVYRAADVPFGWHSGLSAACATLGARAVVSHRAAGALWGLDGCEAPPLETTLPGTGTRSVPGVIVHRTRLLPVADRAEREGLPVTRPARTVIDLAAVVDGERLEAALDSALRDGHVSLDHLERRLASLGTHGRGGVETLHLLIEERRGGRPADSRWENRVLRALVAAGLPAPERQFELRDEERRLIARFDLAYPERRIGIEFESYQHHFGRQAWRKDTSRHNRATALGWLVFHLTKGDEVAPVAAAYRAAA